MILRSYKFRLYPNKEVEKKLEEQLEILKRAMGYMLMAGAVVTQPEGERFILNHTPQPPASVGCPPFQWREEVTRNEIDKEFWGGDKNGCI